MVQAVGKEASHDCGLHNIPLMSHHDVVGAEGKWEHDPFGGEIADGRLWGRGTVDTKAPLFAEFSALEELLGASWEPPCNVFLASSHNEELGGDGIPTVLAHFKGRGLTFEVVLDEGGAIIDPPLGGMTCEKCAMVAVHEKGRYKLNCTASAASAHAGLSAAAAGPIERMAGFLREAAAGAMLGTMCSFSRIEGNDKRCSAVVSFKAVDEGDMAADLDALRKAAEKYGVETEIDPASEYHGPADMGQPAFAYTKGRIRAVFPDYPPVPFILPAGTDARWLTEICPCVLRFAPIRLSAQQLASVHSENENIGLDAAAGAVAFYIDFLRNYK